jgi:hypothetical protein
MNHTVNTSLLYTVARGRHCLAPAPDSILATVIYIEWLWRKGPRSAITQGVTTTSWTYVENGLLRYIEQVGNALLMGVASQITQRYHYFNLRRLY